VDFLRGWEIMKEAVQKLRNKISEIYDTHREPKLVTDQNLRQDGPL
jgi:hypothetical protein